MKPTRSKKETTKPYSIRLTIPELKKLKELARKKTAGNMAELIRQALNQFS